MRYFRKAQDVFRFCYLGQISFQNPATPNGGNYRFHHGIFFFLVLYLHKSMDVLYNILRGSYLWKYLK